MKPDVMLLNGSKDMYGIYQMKNTKENKEYLKQGLLHPLNENHKVYRENYELIYEGDIYRRTTCEDLVNRIRSSPPEDFPENGTKDGHIIALSQGGNVEFYYTEEYGAVPVKDFAEGFSIGKEQYNNMSEEDILSTVLSTAHAAFDELNSHDLDYGLRVMNAKIYGSRENGNYKPDSDIDVLLEYEGDLKESDVFNIVNEEGISIAGMKLDINPIRAQESGTIEEFLKRDAERRLTENQEIGMTTFEPGDVLVFKDGKKIRENEEYHIIKEQEIMVSDEHGRYEAYAVKPTIENPDVYDLEYPFEFSLQEIDAVIRDGVRYDLSNVIPIQNKQEVLPTRFFVDIDGVLAKFKQVDTLETLYEKGYFLNLEPIENAIETVKIIKAEHPEIEVYILSSVLSDSEFALEEKNEWLNTYLPEIDMEHRLFPPCGVNKASCVPDGIGETDFLWDDYTHNLTSWEPPARGIKLLNGINHTNETWQGNMLRFDKDPRELADNILDIMGNGKLIQDMKPQEDIDTVLTEWQQIRDDIKGIHKRLSSIQKDMQPGVVAEEEQKKEVVQPIPRTKNKTSPKL